MERTVCSFKSTRRMMEQMNAIMERWDIDRTSVIKLGLYMLAAHTSKKDVRSIDNLYELLESVEKLSPKSFMRFEEFAG